MMKLDINYCCKNKETQPWMFFFFFSNSKTEQSIFYAETWTEPNRRLFIRMQP